MCFLPFFKKDGAGGATTHSNPTKAPFRHDLRCYILLQPVCTPGELLS